MLGKYLKDAGPPIYYIAGPPDMVKGLHEMLNKAGVNDDDIRGGRICKLLSRSRYLTFFTISPVAKSSTAICR